ncbi:MAG: SDR family oxidoreductase [Dehalococcoidia bacterium]|nr:cyclopentanol dehydrogenase [Dehalococcoidia bacterium]MCH2494187.1 SDR family oxidoreductase [Dehalococcoidia bacterium]|tara:strand:+ start:36428 stop:37180 length:753 start_codon:yes stop_codon:yes gene_type:complete
MNRLSNKVALISGGARGIGEYTARLFLKEGASVIIGDKDISRCKKTINELQKEGYDCSFVALDVSKESDWIDAISHIESNYQKLDILINNAGIYNTIPIEQTHLDDFNNIISVNLTGLFLGTKHSIPILRKAGGGSIVNMSSTAGLVGNSGSGAYGASKGGVRSFTKYTAVQHAMENIRANSIHPGPIETDMLAEKLSNIESRSASESKIPMGRIGTIKEVAMAILFLASDESSYITGAELVVDGGLTAR